MFEKWNLRGKKQKEQDAPDVGFVYEGATFADFLLPPEYTRLADSPEVSMAVHKMADLVSNMTIHLLENTDKGDKRVRNALSRKIDVNPYRYMTRKGWVYKIVTDLLLHGDGNSIVQIVMEDDLISELSPLCMGEVSYNQEKKGEYSITYRGQKYRPGEFVHFAINPSQDYPWKGSGYRIALREITQNLKQASKTKNSFMSGEYMPNVVIKVDANTAELASEAGREAVRQKYIRESRAGVPWVIPADMMDVQAIKPLSLEDIAINASVEIDKRTVAGILGIPPFFLGVGDFDKDAYNNFVDTRIMGLAQVITQTLTRDLLYSENWYFKFNPRSLYAYNMTDMVTAGTAMIDRNALRRNELRDWIGLNPDEEMEDLLVLENYLHQEDLGKQKKLKGGEKDGE